MQKSLLKLILSGFIFIGSTSQMTFAQGQFWGTTSQGGNHDLGVIYKVNADGTNFTVEKSLMLEPNNPGTSPQNDLLLASNGKIYGLAISGGANNQGVLFEYDPATATFLKKVDFESTTTGSAPIGGLTEAANGKLYGVASKGGVNNNGGLFEFDPATGIALKKFDFNNFYQPGGNLLLASGKLYGVFSGGQISRGAIYEYDPVSGNFLIKGNFTSQGAPVYGLTMGVNGKCYGQTDGGGANNNGSIFEFDLSTSELTTKYDFSNEASYPAGLLALANSGKLYGTFTNGGTKGRGILFEFDPATSSFSKKLDFYDGNFGATPRSGLFRASNGKLYGTTSFGGNNGDLFEYNPDTNQFVEKFSFNNPTGGFPINTSVIEGSSGKLYGLTTQGGAGNAGVLYEYNLATGVYTKKFDFNAPLEGKGFSGSLARSTITNKLYGMTREGGAFNRGVLFEYDPTSKMYSKKVDLDGINIQTNNFYEGMTEDSNGKLYWLGGGGGVNYQGAIFEFDPLSGVVTRKFDFQNATSGSSPTGSLFLASNNKFYGVTTLGGVNDNGLFF